MTRSKDLFRYSLLALAATTMVACNDKNNPPAPTPAPAPAPTPTPTVTPDTYVLTSGNKLVGFAQADTTKTTSLTLMGLGAGETLVGMDFRPTDRALYVVSKVGTTGAKTYKVNLTTGALESGLTLASAAGPIVLTGTKFGVDFNPVANRLRVIGDDGQNLRIDVAATAATNTIVDVALSPVGSATTATGLSEAAYTNSFDATCRTTLFYLNSTTNQLALSLDPNGGKFRVAGALATATAPVGFDVRTGTDGSNTLQALATANGALSLVDVSSANGAASNPRPVTLASGETAVGFAATLPATVPATQAAGNLVALTSLGELLTFNRPATGSPAKACTGPTAITFPAGTTGVTIVGMDTRPNDGTLIGLGSDSKLYTLNAASGAATLKSSLNDGAAAPAPFTIAAGATFGVDFNPTVDRLRVVSSTGQNLRINVDTGAVINDTALNGGATGATAVGYTNSIGGGNGTVAASATALFYLDTTDAAANSKLLSTTNPNGGVTTVVGTDTGINLEDANAFEIEGRTGVAYIAGKTAAAAGSSLYTVDLVTGVINPTALGAFAGGKIITGLATNGSFSATVFALTTAAGGAQAITSFAPGNPATTTTPVALSGLTGTEKLVGIDFRPSSVGAAGNVLFGVSSTNKLYTVNTTTGALTAVGAGLVPAASGDTAGASTFSALSGTKFGVDFNPVPDRIRVVSDMEQNIRINPANAQVNSDLNLSPAGSIVSAAYTRNFDCHTGGTALYGIDNASNNLVRVGADPSDGSACTGGTTDANPNCGDVTVIGAAGALGQTIVGDVGFDIVGGQNGFVLASYGTASGGQTTLYKIVLGTGVAAPVGLIGGAASTTPVQDIAIGLVAKP